MRVTLDTEDGGFWVGVTCLGQTQRLPIDVNSAVTARFRDDEPKKCAASNKRRRRKATKQELDAADIHGGRRHKGSGALNYLKSDASTRHKYRMECKSTAARSTTIKRELLNKLRAECTPGQVPVFLLQFNHPTTLRTEDEWVLVPKSEWEKRVAETDDD